MRSGGKKSSATPSWRSKTDSAGGAENYSPSKARAVGLNARSSRGARRESSWRRSCRACRCASIFPRSRRIRRRALFFHLRQRRGRMRAPLIGRVRAAPAPPASRRNRVRSGAPAPLHVRSPGRRLVAFHHWAHCGERSTAAAEVVVNGHRSLRWLRTPGAQAGRSAAPPLCRAEHHLSGDIGISTALITCLVGPAAHGMTSKSKMSVGSHKVAHAFGMSTTPEMCPWHGAVPRMA